MPRKKTETATPAKPVAVQPNMEREMNALTNCYDELVELDHAARKRVIDWLNSWAFSMAHPGLEDL